MIFPTWDLNYELYGSRIGDYLFLLINIVPFVGRFARWFFTISILMLPNQTENKIPKKKISNFSVLTFLILLPQGFYLVLNERGWIQKHPKCDEREEFQSKLNGQPKEAQHEEGSQRWWVQGHEDRAVRSEWETRKVSRLGESCVRRA